MLRSGNMYSEDKIRLHAGIFLQFKKICPLVDRPVIPVVGQTPEYSLLERIAAFHEALPQRIHAYFALLAQVIYPAVNNYLLKGSPHILLVILVTAGDRIPDRVNIVHIVLTRSCGKPAQIGAVFEEKREIVPAEIHKIAGVEQCVDLIGIFPGYIKLTRHIGGSPSFR